MGIYAPAGTELRATPNPVGLARCGDDGPCAGTDLEVSFVVCSTSAPARTEVSYHLAPSNAVRFCLPDGEMAKRWRRARPVVAAPEGTVVRDRIRTCMGNAGRTPSDCFWLSVRIEEVATDEGFGLVERVALRPAS